MADFRFSNLTDEQQEALGWALEMAHYEQNEYMNYGNPHVDYGSEWPDAARLKAGYCRSIAAIAEIVGLETEWNQLAEQFETSAKEYEEQEASR